MNLELIEKLRLCANDKRRLVIIPMGSWGEECKKILEKDFGMEDIRCLDNYNYDNHKVYRAERADNWKPDALYLITAINEHVRWEIRQQLEKHVDDSQIVELFSEELFSEELISKWICQYGKVHLDFLCCGFAKCSTSSLHIALKQNPNIYLPEVKETHFIEGIHLSNAHRIFHESYPLDLTKGKIVGGIEPAYLNSARMVHSYFGDDLKILFCVRNPVKALYSLFRMHMRDAYGDKVFYYLEKYKKISPDAFDEWVERENERETFLYINYIKQYMKYYSANQIKIIIMEEMIRFPNKIMSEIQDFIGLERQYVKEYKEIPYINKGDYVPKDLACAYVNRSMMELVSDAREKGADFLASMQLIRNQVGYITNEPYCQEMHKETEHKLIQFYMDSIQELERFIDKSLRGIWY